MSESELPSGNIVPPEELKRAFKAFKKRLKLTRLDHESSLGVGPLSGGRPSGIVAITPPNQYPFGRPWSNRDVSKMQARVYTS